MKNTVITNAAEMFDFTAELLNALNISSLDTYDYGENEDNIIPNTPWQDIPDNAYPLFDVEDGLKVEYRINFSLKLKGTASIEFRVLPPKGVDYGYSDIVLDTFNLPTWFNRNYPLGKALQELCLTVHKPDDTSVYDCLSIDNYDYAYNNDKPVLDYDDIVAPCDPENVDYLDKVFKDLGCTKANWFTLQALLNRTESYTEPNDPSWAVMPGRYKGVPALFYCQWYDGSYIMLDEFNNSPYKYQAHLEEGRYILQPTLKGTLNPDYDNNSENDNDDDDE